MGRGARKRRDPPVPQFRNHGRTASDQSAALRDVPGFASGRRGVPNRSYAEDRGEADRGLGARWFSPGVDAGDPLGTRQASASLQVVNEVHFHGPGGGEDAPRELPPQMAAKDEGVSGSDSEHQP